MNKRNSILDVAAVGVEEIQPDAQGVLAAISRIGYSFEVSIADIVDNSIDADARHVLIRFYRSRDRLLSLGIFDDGHGMDDEELSAAMQFGAQLEHDEGDLGHYGLGLKSASFGFCDRLTVISRRSRKTGGRRWTKHNINQGWMCQVLDPRTANPLLRQSVPLIDTTRRGTLILWEDVAEFDRAHKRVDEAIEDYVGRLSQHLGLFFHRFLEAEDVTIYLDAFDIESGEAGLPYEIAPLNPVGYKRSGHPDFPITFGATANGVDVPLDAHIWSTKSQSPQYRLGKGQVARRQGFYYYRNDRLIQAGGWNGWRSDGEPHYSLARVVIDLPPGLDSTFRLNVQKSGVDPPPDFIRSLDKLKRNGRTLKQYYNTAGEVYRDSRREQEESVLPAVLGAGLTKPAARRLSRVLVPGRKERRSVDIVWRRLPLMTVFEVERRAGNLVLNQRYRKVILRGGRGSTGDAALVKTLLFLLVREEFSRKRVRASHDAHLEVLNQALLVALKEDG